MKKLLLVSCRLPFPVTSGDTFVLNRHLIALTSKYEVDLLCFNDAGCDVEHIKKFFSIKNVFIIKSNPLFKLFIPIVFILFRYPIHICLEFCIFRYLKIQKILKDNDYDYVHSYLLRTAPYFKGFEHEVFLSLLDSMTLNLKRRLQNDYWLFKPILLLEYILCRSYENRIKTMFKRIVVVSNIDSNYFSSEKVVVINIPVDIPKKVLPVDSKVIVFSGNMYYFPNIEAVIWFYENCFLSLVNKFPDLIFKIVGRNPSSSILNLGLHPNIIVTGEVSSVLEEIQSSKISIAPMQSGSGMQIKILESLSCGVPVVATTLGKGDIKSSESILIADNPGDMIAKISFLLTNDLTEFSYNAYDLITENYSPEVIQKKYLSLYQ